MRIFAFLSLLCCFVLPDTSRAAEPGAISCAGLCVTVEQAAGDAFRTVSGLECDLGARACRGSGMLLIEGKMVPVMIAGRLAQGSLVLQMRSQTGFYAGRGDTDFFLMPLRPAAHQQEQFEFHRVPAWGSVRYDRNKPVPLIFRTLEPLGTLRVTAQWGIR